MPLNPVRFWLASWMVDLRSAKINEALDLLFSFSSLEASACVVQCPAKFKYASAEGTRSASILNAVAI